MHMIPNICISLTCEKGYNDSDLKKDPMIEEVRLGVTTTSRQAFLLFITEFNGSI